MARYRPPFICADCGKEIKQIHQMSKMQKLTGFCGDTFQGYDYSEHEGCDIYGVKALKGDIKPKQQ